MVSMSMGATIFMIGIAIFVCGGFFGVFTGILPLSYLFANIGIAIAFIGLIIWTFGFFFYLIR